MQLIKLFCGALALLTTQVALSAEPTHVVVDPSDQYTTTYLGVPKSLPKEKFENIKKGLFERKGSYLVTWREFKRDPAKHIKPHIRRNDYPDVDVVRGLTRLLERYDGTPLGLTWNGGLAMTGNDYRHAARTFDKFQSNPNSVAKESDRRRDPVHPENHLGPLLR
jgi:hypothetical protein